ncbi:hypothetical protein D3C80_1254370 [compost metagenome]
MYKRYLRSKTSQKSCFLQSGITTAYHDNFFTAEEKSVTSRTGTNSATYVILLSRNPQILGTSACRKDDRICNKLAEPFYLQLERPLAHIHTINPARAEFCTKALRLLTHIIH